MNPEKHKSVIQNMYFQNYEFISSRILLKTDYWSGNTLHTYFCSVSQ